MTNSTYYRFVSSGTQAAPTPVIPLSETLQLSGRHGPAVLIEHVSTGIRATLVSRPETAFVIRMDGTTEHIDRGKTVQIAAGDEIILAPAGTTVPPAESAEYAYLLSIWEPTEEELASMQRPQVVARTTTPEVATQLQLAIQHAINTGVQATSGALILVPPGVDAHATHVLQAQTPQVPPSQTDVQVSCGDKVATARYHLGENKKRRLTLQCMCEQCTEGGTEGPEFVPAHFEKHAGKGSFKKWKQSIRLKDNPRKSLWEWMESAGWVL